MIEIKDIKPIPKYIERLIKIKDKRIYPYGDNNRRFYSYLTKFNGELAKVTVAVRNKYKNWYCKQVIVHGIHNDKCFAKDIVFYYIAGYVVGWFSEGLTKEPKPYEDDEWGWIEDNKFDPFAPVINPEFALKFKEYKYSLADQYCYTDIFKYLRTYEKYPQAEYVMKLGLTGYATSKQILDLIAKDKKFRTWLIKNHSKIALKEYYISTILKAYKQSKDLEKVQQFELFIKSFAHTASYKKIKEVFNGDIERFFNYIIEQKTDEHSYMDYFRACESLGIDMTESKNLTPHNFKYWHDVRIDQYHTQKALKDAEERKELYDKFGVVANKYLGLQRNLKDNFVVIIAKSPSELIHEGDFLHHCVGRMNYDQKFAREETLIFFVRNKDNIETPFVTLEYSLENKKILQCYADHDSKPEDNVLDFVNKVWLPYANRKLKKIHTEMCA